MKLVALLFAALLPLALAKAPLLNRNLENVVPDNYIVILKSDITTAKARSYYQSMRISFSAKKLAGTKHRGVRRTFENVDGMNAFHVECDNKTVEDIRNHPHVEAIYEDGHVIVQAAMPGLEARDDQVAGLTWGLGRISHRNPGLTNYVDETPIRTRMYVLDTGIRMTHEQFGGRATWGANFIDGSPNTDENGHGTHTAATAAGNTVGVDNTTIPVAVKCLDKTSAGTWSGIIAAIDWAVGDATSRKCIQRSVINMSIGGPTFQPLDDMVASAVSKGMTIVVAASNYGANASDYSPARSPAAITVAAIDRSDTRPSWSNYGEDVAIFAPGTDISSAWLSGDASYATLSGTSMAAPHVAGLATYLMSREGLSGPLEVRKRLLELATKDKVQDAQGSPNLIAFNGADGDE
ncbi:peptidase S8/S53 domain-containing protein [Xylariales sp. AK1849]|nr:peptidase S8/S53 domain-containing protein [Xylariales sp. AK1849]